MMLSAALSEEITTQHEKLVGHVIPVYDVLQANVELLRSQIWDAHIEKIIASAPVRFRERVYCNVLNCNCDMHYPI